MDYCLPFRVRLNVVRQGQSPKQQKKITIENRITHGLKFQRNVNASNIH